MKKYFYLSMLFGCTLFAFSGCGNNTITPTASTTPDNQKSQSTQKPVTSVMPSEIPEETDNAEVPAEDVDQQIPEEIDEEEVIVE